MAERFEPIDPEQLLDLASWQLTGSRYADAVATARQILERDPLDDRAMRLLAHAAAANDDDEAFDDAIRRLRATGGSTLELEKLAVSREGLGALGTSQHGDPSNTGAARADPGEAWRRHPQVVLLERRVDRIHEDGSMLTDHQEILRVQSESARDALGELESAGESWILSMRTIEPDGTVHDSDRHAGLSDLSARSLSRGDAIERRRVSTAPAAGPFGGYRARFFFQRFQPLVRAEWILLSKDPLRHRALNGAPNPVIEAHDGFTKMIFAASNRWPAIEEPDAAPPEEYLPYVVAWSGMDRRSALESNAMLARRLLEKSALVDARARALVEGIDDDVERFEVLTGWIEDTISSGLDNPPFLTLLTRRGSRTALLRAMAEAIGLRSELVIARAGTEARVRAVVPDPQYFGHLIGRAWLEGRWRWFNLDTWEFDDLLPSEFRGGAFFRAESLEPASIEMIPDGEIRSEERKVTLDLVLNSVGAIEGKMQWVLRTPASSILASFAETVPEDERIARLESALSTTFGQMQLQSLRIERDGSSLEADVLIEDMARLDEHRYDIDAFFEGSSLDPLFGATPVEAVSSMPERTTPLVLQESRESLIVRLRYPPDAFRGDGGARESASNHAVWFLRAELLVGRQLADRDVLPQRVDPSDARPTGGLRRVPGDDRSGAR
ncbi:MAG: hypothetical protein HC923_01825 [Myxococcales bacterium]|nr:hypothetical protein [Myxococcales bacterium]